jgi:hypothetical protein
MSVKRCVDKRELFRCWRRAEKGIARAVLKLCERGEADADVLSSSIEGKSFRRVLRRDLK